MVLIHIKSKVCPSPRYMKSHVPVGLVRWLSEVLCSIVVPNPPWPHLSREESAPNIWRHSSRAERDIPKDTVESSSSASSSWV